MAIKRTIKFRAWDKEKNKMIDWPSLMPFAISFLMNTESIEFMQYTGLKDRNGKEIYEGDVVNYEKETWFIEYFGDRFRLVQKVTKDTFKHAIGEIRVNDEVYEERMYWGSVEVIGNLYDSERLVN